MALQTSGQISLNDIHVEVGGTSASQASLNDADIRGLIGKSSGAQNSFNEYYGASAVEALSGWADSGTTNTVTGLSFNSLSQGDVIIGFSGYNARTTNGQPQFIASNMQKNLTYLTGTSTIDWGYPSPNYEAGVLIQIGIAGSSTPNSFSWNANMDAAGTGVTAYALLKVSGGSANATQFNHVDLTHRGERAFNATTVGSGGATTNEEITMTDIANTHDVGIAVAGKFGTSAETGTDPRPWSFGTTGDEKGYVDTGVDWLLQWYVKREEDTSGTFTDISVDTGEFGTAGVYLHAAVGIP
jgi:hypothetical protein